MNRILMLNLVSWFKFIKYSLVTSITSFLFHSSSGIHYYFFLLLFIVHVKSTFLSFFDWVKKMKLWNSYIITLNFNEIIPSVTLNTLIIACFYYVSFINFMISYHFHFFPFVFWNFHNFSRFPLFYPFWLLYLTLLNN